jgi:hypothetical protein
MKTSNNLMNLSSEYTFGQHALDTTGIFDMQPKDVVNLGNDQFKFKLNF